MRPDYPGMMPRLRTRIRKPRDVNTIQVAPGQLASTLSSCPAGSTLVVEGQQTVNLLNITKSVRIENKAGQRATIQGRLVFKAGSDGLTINGGDSANGLILRGDYTGQNVGEPSWTVNAANITIANCELTNTYTAIGINSNSAGSGLIVEGCRIHAIGPFHSTQAEAQAAAGGGAVYQWRAGAPNGHANQWCENLAHGIYLGGNTSTIRYCEVWDCADRGIQLRGASNCLVEYTWVHDCGMGIMYGDLTTNNNTVRYSTVEDQWAGSGNRYCLESYATGTGHTFQGYAETVQPSISCTVTNVARTTAYGPSWMT